MSEHCDSCEYKNKKEICKTGLWCRMKEAEKEVSFDEWFRSEKFNGGFDCNQVTSAKLAWDFKERQISSLKKELEEARKIAREACERLKLYGSENNWSLPYERQGVIGRQIKVELHRDGGRVAREFLAREDVKKFLEDNNKGETKMKDGRFESAREMMRND